MDDGFIIKDGILKAYTLREAVVKIPDEVKEIGKGAFKGCASIERVILPETVTSIMDTAFKGCRKLKIINFPSKLNYIGEYAFHRCHSLHSVELPVSVKSLSNCAFLYCDSLEYVSMIGVTNLERHVFSNDANLKTIEVSSNLDISSICDVFTGCSKVSRISLCDGTIYDIESVIEIISSHSNVHPVVKAISTDIYRMMEIDEGMPQIVHTIHSQILNNFFISGTTLVQYRGKEERVVVPEGITVIGEKAFAGNEAVGKVILPDSIREIREEAFVDFLLLQTINLHEGLEYIGQSAFENCVKLIRADLPESLTIIEKSTFNRCRKLNEVVFGSNVKEIRNLAFYSCNSLKNVYLPEKLISIGDMAFYKCLSLTEIHLPESLYKLGNNVFTASGIKSAVINCDLKECGTDIFSECNKLRNLTFCEGVKSIGDKFAFRCHSLKYVNLPSSIEYIGRNAFEDSIYIKEMA